MVGHVEWVQSRGWRTCRARARGACARPFRGAGRGGAVAGVQLARLAGSCTLITALGDDEYGRRSLARLRELAVDVAHAHASADASCSDARRRRARAHDHDLRRGACSRRETRTSQRGGAWPASTPCTSPPATRPRCACACGQPRARRRSAPRHALGHGVPIDALVLSAAIDRAPRVATQPSGCRGRRVTEGKHGGSSARARVDCRFEAAPLLGDPVDAYGCADSFAAGFTYGLGAGLS